METTIDLKSAALGFVKVNEALLPGARVVGTLGNLDDCMLSDSALCQRISRSQCEARKAEGILRPPGNCRSKL